MFVLEKEPSAVSKFQPAQKQQPQQEMEQRPKRSGNNKDAEITSSTEYLLGPEAPSWPLSGKGDKGRS